MRNEIKYRSDFGTLMNIIIKLGGVQSYPTRQVNSIYFDDIFFSDFNDSEEGTVPRKKIRFRWYGKSEIKFPSKGTLEIKETHANHREKHSRRFDNPVSSIDLIKVAESIRNKILQPVLLVSYKREYFETSEGLRLTLDYNIEFSKLDSNHAIIAKSSDLSNILELKVGIDKDYESISREFSNLRVRYSKYCEGLNSFNF